MAYTMESASTAADHIYVYILEISRCISLALQVQLSHWASSRLGMRRSLTARFESWGAPLATALACAAIRTNPAVSSSVVFGEVEADMHLRLQRKLIKCLKQAFSPRPVMKFILPRAPLRPLHADPTPLPHQPTRRPHNTGQSLEPLSILLQRPGRSGPPAPCSPLPPGASPNNVR